MEIALVIVAFVFLLVGVAGSIVPALPGPSLSFIGLILIQLSGQASFSHTFLWTWAIIAIIVTTIDYFLPTLMTKRFGGSKLAIIGSTLGLILGMLFFPPFGIIIGPFLGALIGELISQKNRHKVKNHKNKVSFAKALKVALGAFLAFILGTGAKLLASLIMLFQAVVAMFN